MSFTDQSRGNPHGLSQRDLEVAAALWLSFADGEPKIDWDKFAINGGYKNANAARASTLSTRKKLQALIASTSAPKAEADIAIPSVEGPVVSPKTPKKASAKKTPAKRKAPAAGGDVGDENAGPAATPTTKRKQAAKKAKVAIKPEPDVGGGNINTNFRTMLEPLIDEADAEESRAVVQSAHEESQETKEGFNEIFQDVNGEV